MARFLPFAALLTVVLGGCGWFGKDGWRAEVDRQTGQLGYRNWIVVAEASFPAHSRAGIRQVKADDTIPNVLDEVLRLLERTEHVRPQIYTTRELRAVENDFAPGIDEYRRQLEWALHGFEPVELEQDSLVTLMTDAQRSFEVLVIRTETALPYSSVFLELQPGYWDGESEARMRRRLERQGRERLASPDGRAQVGGADGEER